MYRTSGNILDIVFIPDKSKRKPANEETVMRRFEEKTGMSGKSTNAKPGTSAAKQSTVSVCSTDQLGLELSRYFSTLFLQNRDHMALYTTVHIMDLLSFARGHRYMLG
jgi:hypothetical protein